MKKRRRKKEKNKGMEDTLREALIELVEGIEEREDYEYRQDEKIEGTDEGTGTENSIKRK